MEGEAKKRGRPRKMPEKGRRQNYTFRMSDETRDLVIDAAAKAGRSVSEEIERRVEASFATQTPSLTAEDVRQIVREEMVRPKPVVPTITWCSTCDRRYEAGCASADCPRHWPTGGLPRHT